MISRVLPSLTVCLALGGCSLEFNTALIPSDGGAAGRDSGAVKSDARVTTTVAPAALWWFADEGTPAVVPDRAARGFGIDLYPVLGTDVGRGQVQMGVWVSTGGELRSDSGAANALGAAIKTSQAFSLEAWAEADPTLAGKGNVIGCDMFAIKQTRIGTEVGISLGQWITGAIDPTPTTRLRHIVTTYAASKGISRMYIDGTEADAKNLANQNGQAPAIVVPAEELRASLGGQGWIGKMHLAAIYDVELSPNDVRALFALGPARR